MNELDAGLQMAPYGIPVAFVAMYIQYVAMLHKGVCFLKWQLYGLNFVMDLPGEIIRVSRGIQWFVAVVAVRVYPI